jgi:hypothetical protein
MFHQVTVLHNRAEDRDWQSIITVTGRNCKQPSTIVDAFGGKSKGGKSDIIAGALNGRLPFHEGHDVAGRFVTTSRVANAANANAPGLQFGRFVSTFLRLTA